MGVWTWLDRWDPRIVERVPLDDLWRHRDGPLHVEGIDTHRGWHALHVALTGEEEGGAAPWCHVVWTTPGAQVSFPEAHFAHAAEVTREVADFLPTVDLWTAVDTLYAARELGIFIYSFDLWPTEAGGETRQDIVACGLFGRVFDEVRRFYVAAAAGGQIVTVHRG